jgi:hypothetical protein
MIQKLRELGEAATISPEVRAYMQNVVVFLRIERGVAGGVTPYATVLFEALSKSVFVPKAKITSRLTFKDIWPQFTAWTMLRHRW